MPEPPSITKLDILASNFEQLPTEVKQPLSELLQVRLFTKGQSIFLQDDQPEAIYIVSQGRVKINRVALAGNETILCMRSPGDIFCPVPILDDGNQLGTAIAVTDVELLWGSRKGFYQLCESYPELLVIVQRDCLHEVRRLMQRFEERASLKVEERLALVLLKRSQRLPGRVGPKATLQITHEDLAGWIGSSRESVSRCLVDFEKQGILKIFRGRLEIHALNKLTQICSQE